MSVLIIYDGWQHLRLADVAGIIIGPVVAMFLAHVFSAAMAQQVELGRHLDWVERTTIVRSEAPFLLLCVPPLVIVVVLNLGGVSLNDSIKATLWVGVASLGLWGGIAGPIGADRMAHRFRGTRRAHRRLRRTHLASDSPTRQGRLWRRRPRLIAFRIRATAEASTESNQRQATIASRRRRGLAPKNTDRPSAR